MAHRACPWWFGWFLVSPLRRFAHNPERILGPHLTPGMTAVDFGCGMGHFSLAMARAVGPAGRAICIDLQEEMLAGLRRRAGKAGLLDRLEVRRVTAADAGLDDLEGRVDFILAMFVVHEAPDAARLLKSFAAALKPAGRLLIVEPILHVRRRDFEETIAAAQRAGLRVVDRPAIRRSRAALLGPA